MIAKKHQFYENKVYENEIISLIYPYEKRSKCLGRLLNVLGTFNVSYVCKGTCCHL